MKPIRVQSAAEQVAGHLRRELAAGTWKDTMPGAARLAAELGVGRNTIEAALDELERAGLLLGQGGRKRRKVVARENSKAPSLRVQVLPYERADQEIHYMVHLVHSLRQAGHVSDFSTKSLVELGMDAGRIQRQVESTEADAWVIGSGSRNVLEWFSDHPKPAFALAGRRRGVSIAGTGPDKFPAQKQLVTRLVELGHRRIVVLARKDRRKPQPAAFERAFLESLQNFGISVGAYNLPDWDERPGGLQRCLEALFQHTPPTALFIEEMPLFLACLQHLAAKGIVAPRDVSLVCGDPNHAFDWCQPSVSHIDWEARPLIRRIVKWANNVARGITDRRQGSIRARFVEGGTIGPAP